MPTTGQVPSGPLMSAPTTPNLARIPAGEFLMGASDAEDDERPVHRVYVGEFFMGRFPVTQEDYARFARATPSRSLGAQPPVDRLGGARKLFTELATPHAWTAEPPPVARHPVVLIHEDAEAYCRWLGDTLGRDVRLPTEAEWEKAARGGVEGQRYPWGNDIDASRCNYLADPSVKRQKGTQPAGMYSPNARPVRHVRQRLGMGGDWYGADSHCRGDTSDPRVRKVREHRILRGGSWVTDDVSMLRCSYRQSAARHLRVQHRIQDRLLRVTTRLCGARRRCAPNRMTKLPRCYARASRLLMRRDPVLGAAIKRIGPCGLADRQRKDHLSALVGAIVSQQLSTKAAATIFRPVRRPVRGQHDLPSATAIAALSDEALRGVGLSGQKVGYLRDLCARIADGRLQLDELDALPDEQVIERLTSVKGFGRWTAEMFLMFRLHRPDVAAGRRPGHRQRHAAAVRPAQAAGCEADPEDGRSVEAVSIGRVVVSVADAAKSED